MRCSEWSAPTWIFSTSLDPRSTPSGFAGDMVTVPVHLVAVPAADARDDLRLILRITDD